jgi:hypothetical protein
MGSDSGAAGSNQVLQKGVCYVLFAYDPARSIDLDAAERRIHEATQRQSIQHKRRAPSYLEYQPPPLRLSQEIEPIKIGEYQSHRTVDLVLYDFGAVSVIYSIPIQGPFAALLALSEDLYDNEILLTESRARVEQIISALGNAAVNVHSASLVEDYVIFRIAALDPSTSPEAFCASHARDIARILRAERQSLSFQEVEDALSARTSYGTEDLTVIDWNAALLVDREGDDVQAVLEFANVELLEMRYLDQKLDRALFEAYETLSKRSWSLPRFLGYYSADLRRVAELQVDNALLFEGVNNTLKLLGDQYLARVYRLVNRRFHLADWDSSIIRKLQTLESIYEKIADQAATRRLEILEWVIIILIAFSILLEFIPLTGSHR